MKSCAIPKGPSINPENKKLAVLITDHALDYAEFEGYIEEGGHGVRPIIIRDTGLVVYEDDHVKSFNQKKINFKLNGEKLHRLFPLLLIWKLKTN